MNINKPISSFSCNFVYLYKVAVFQSKSATKGVFFCQNMSFHSKRAILFVQLLGYRLQSTAQHPQAVFPKADYIKTCFGEQIVYFAQKHMSPQISFPNNIDYSFRICYNRLCMRFCSIRLLLMPSAKVIVISFYIVNFNPKGSIICPPKNTPWSWMR